MALRRDRFLHHGFREKVQLERWLARQEVSILHAMEQTRQISVEVEPYWQD